MKQLLNLSLAIFTCLLSSAQVILPDNTIATENALPGNPISEWGVPDFREERINGFSTKMSLNSGETVHFKINSQGDADFSLKIYRIGYYGGNGARLQIDLGTMSGTAQPSPLSDAATGMVDCSNWSESASWTIPASAVSGLYIAKLERTGGGSNHVAFIVRNDSRNSDLYLQIPDATWQAYNGYGGNSLYDGTTGYPGGHAVKVSYNRPFFPYDAGFFSSGSQANWYMDAEYPMIRWLEQNGYDVSYTSCNDVDRNGTRILNHKVFVSVGHDEYWSKNMRLNVETARGAGIHLAFFSGNEVYWKTRWENTLDGEDRTLVCYKEGLMGNGTTDEKACGTKCDNTSEEWTGLWRTGGDYDAGRPENALSGQISWTEKPDKGTIQVPSYYKKLRFWRNTAIATMADGAIIDLAQNSLGQEWNYEQQAYESSYPSGRMTLSSTTYFGLTHKLSLYRRPNGAFVFGAGTIHWVRGLDNNNLGAITAVNKDMQQATVNLFADMGVQPLTLQFDLVAATASTDISAPASTISSPATGSNFSSWVPVTITGTATDEVLVAGVEVSVDGGLSWHAAELSALDGSTTWTYTWTPTPETAGTINVKARAFDDSGNMETAGPGINLTIGAPGYPFHIFHPSVLPAQQYNDLNINLGVRFKPNVSGFITGVRFYKQSGNDGTHIGNIWNRDTEEKLAEVTFTSETATGWQEAIFPEPVPVTAGQVYTASYFCPLGKFSVTEGFFATQGYPVGPTSLWPAQALANTDPDGGNGVVSYSNGPSIPTIATGDNYFVDIIFTIDAPLPVRLLNLSATPNDNSIVLRWSTASELNNNGFEVQRRSATGDWTVIGFVKGAGTSNSILNYTYTDENLPAGRYSYRLKQIDIDGRFEYSPVVLAAIDAIEKFSLEQNYPNPFSNETIIKFTLPQKANVRLSLFDMHGRMIKTLVNGIREKGSHAVTLNAAALSPGLYFYKLESDKFSAVKKMTFQ